MKSQLAKNANLLITYLNVTILSKAFKLNKLLLLNTEGSGSVDDLDAWINDEIAKLVGSNKLSQSWSEMNRKASLEKSNSTMQAIASFSSNNSSFNNDGNSVDYDADVEFSFQGKFLKLIWYKKNLVH
jgi:hypothetical protein